MSIAAAIDELMNEDGTARDFISLEEPRLSVSVGSRTCHPQKAAPQETYQPALPRQLDRHLSTAEAYDALRPIVGPVTRPIKAPSLFECAAPSMPSTSQSALLRTFEAVTPSEGNGKLPAAQMQNSSVDPDIAALISKPDGVASFLNDLEVSLQSGRAVNEGHGANGRPSDPSTHTQIPFAATPTIPSSEPSQSNLAVPSDALAYPVISEPSGILAILAKADSRLRGDAGGSFSSIDGDPIKAFGDLGQSVAIAESRPLRFSSSVPHSPAMDVQQSGRPDAASPAGIFADVSRVALHPVGLHTQPTSVPPLNIPKVLPFADVAIATLKINPVFIKILSDNAFINISDLAEANMNRDDIRLLAASIQEEQKVSKSETIVAILRLDAALQQYKQK